MRLANERGVSMIELMATLVIFTLTLAASWPHIDGYRASLSASRSLDVLAGTLDLARERAVVRHHPVEIRIGEPDEHHYRLHDDTNGDGLIGDGEQVLGPYELPGAMAFGVVNLLGDGRLVFVPAGRLRTGEGGTVQLVNAKGRIKTLEVFGSGLTSRPPAS